MKLICISSGIVLTQLFRIELSNVINRNVLQGFSLLFKDILFGLFYIQKDKMNEYFIINLLLLLAKFHIHLCIFIVCFH